MKQEQSIYFQKSHVSRELLDADETMDCIENNNPPQIKLSFKQRVWCDGKTDKGLEEWII